MNENHQPANDSLIDDLVASTPQANPEFQRQLEDRLLLELYTEKNGRKNDMIHMQNTPARPVSKLPLTLVAAALALMLVGSALVFRSVPSSQPIMGAQATDTAILFQSSFEYGGQVIDPSSAETISAMQRAGMTWLKYQVEYSTEAKIEQLQKIINDAHVDGFKILLTLTGSPAELSQEEYASGYINWLREAAGLGADAIEVWAEPNIDRSWLRGEISGAAYVDLLRQAYEAIKAANPDTLVISAAPAPTRAESAFPAQVMNDDRWLLEVVESGGLEYLDCVGVHYVEGVIPAGKTSDDPRDNTYTRYFGGMVNTYRELTQDQKPLCFTSLGYLSDDGLPALTMPFAWAENVTVGQQAAWLGEAARLASESGMVKLMIVWNVDFTEYDAAPFAGYAMIRPDGSCPACDALEVFKLDTTLIPPMNLQPVVIARYDLPAGARINPSMLTTVYWPIDIIPAGTVTETDIIGGQFLQKDVARWQPVLQYQVSSQSTAADSALQITPQPDATWTFQIDEESVSSDRVIVSIPVEQLQQWQMWELKPGDQVTVLAAMSFIQGDGFFIPVPPDAQNQRAVTYTTPIQEATIVAIETTATGDVIRVATRPTDAMTLQWMVEAKVPITLVVS
jgi:SAF domain